MNSEILPLFILDVKKVSELLYEKETNKDKMKLLFNLKQGLNNIIAQMEETKISSFSYYEKRKFLIKEDDEIQFFISNAIDAIKKNKKLQRDILSRKSGEKIKLTKDTVNGNIYLTNKNTKQKMIITDELEYDEKDRKQLEDIFENKIEELKKLRNFINEEIEIYNKKIGSEEKNEIELAENIECRIEDLIWWKGTEGQLVYLFEKLVECNLIDRSDIDRKYVLLSKHFRNKKGNKFSSKQMSQAAQNLVLNKERKPKQAVIIEKLVNETAEE